MNNNLVEVKDASNLGVNEINEINEINEYLPEEPSVEEQIKIATEELEYKNNDLIQKLYYKEQEIKQLRDALQFQEDNFNKILARAIIAIVGDK